MSELLIASSGVNEIPCWKFLLASGADPTIETEQEASMFDLMLNGLDKVRLRLTCLEAYALRVLGYHHDCSLWRV